MKNKQKHFLLTAALPSNAQTMVHISCIGSAILYMILAGTNLQQLITQIPIGDNEYYMLFNLSAVVKRHPIICN